MNERKRHVIKMAHQLFIEKGFQSTSIQDILEKSGISKGTFYNYFSSKNELLIALIKEIYIKMEQERNELLIGKNPSNIDVFVKQVELQMRTNRTNKLISLFEEVYFSKDDELKDFIKKGQLRIIKWIYLRFIDIFGQDKKPFLLDCTIMFLGILNHNLKYNAFAHGSDSSLYEIVLYCVKRTVKMVEEVSKSGEQLLQPDLIERWLPDSQRPDHPLQKRLYHVLMDIKNSVKQEEHLKHFELLDFIQDELFDSKNPRTFLIESALLSLRAELDSSQMDKFEGLIQEYLADKEDEFLK
jgi:AcrR family transcriptional regulator